VDVVTTLSVVIPTTGRPELAYAVSSARCVADEVIVVCDGYNHGPVEGADVTVCGAYGAPGLARNAAAPYVTTEWVGFLDDDDALVPDVYRATIEQLREADMVITLMNDPDLGNIPKIGLPIMHGNVGISFAVRSDLFRQEPFIAGPPFTMRGEDFEYVRRYMDKQRAVCVSDAVGYIVLPQEART
jgi:hypothetical protein